MHFDQESWSLTQQLLYQTLLKAFRVNLYFTFAKKKHQAH